MWRKLPLILPTALLLTACAGANSSAPVAPRFASVPLVEYSPSEQKAVADHIEAVCGPRASCPYNALLERWIVDYGRLRAMVRAAGRGKTDD